jgi:hypothetical protein
MPWNILHRQSGGLAVTTECDTFDFDEAWLSKRDQLGVAFNLICVPGLDQCQTINSALPLRTNKRRVKEDMTHNCLRLYRLLSLGL